MALFALLYIAIMLVASPSQLIMVCKARVGTQGHKKQLHSLVLASS